MILKVFAVRDLKAEAFLQPFFSNSVGNALRAFDDAVNDKNCPFNKHPGDYSLFEIGTYDDSSALLDSVVPVKMMAFASDLIKDNVNPFVHTVNPSVPTVAGSKLDPKMMLTVKELNESLVDGKK